MTEELTAEEIQARYDAAMDSVNPAKQRQARRSMSDEDWTDTVARNVGHLEIMVAKEDWNDQDLVTIHRSDCCKLIRRNYDG